MAEFYRMYYVRFLANNVYSNRFIILGRCFAAHLRLVSFAAKRLPVFPICWSIFAETIKKRRIFFGSGVFLIEISLSD